MLPSPSYLVSFCIFFLLFLVWQECAEVEVKRSRVGGRMFRVYNLQIMEKLLLLCQSLDSFCNHTLSSTRYAFSPSFPSSFVSVSLPSFFFFVQLTTLVTVSCLCSLDFQFISFSVPFFFSFAVALKNFINCLLTLYLWLSISPSSLAFFHNIFIPCKRV